MKTPHALTVWLLFSASILAASCTPGPAPEPSPGQSPAGTVTTEPPETEADSSEDEGFAAAGISEDEALAIAREQFDFEPLSSEVTAVRESGRDAWRVTLRGRPPSPEAPMGEFGEVVIDRETGDILTISQS